MDTGPVKCIFCRPADPTVNRVLIWGTLAYVRWDNFPLNEHVQVVPFRHVTTPWELTRAERAEIDAHFYAAQEILDRRYAPEGYNGGWNVGEAGGQSVDHAHKHLWTRYLGDDPASAGGITRAGPARKITWGRMG